MQARPSAWAPFHTEELKYEPCGQPRIAAPLRTGERSAACRHPRAGLCQACRGFLPCEVRRYACAMHSERRGERATLLAQRGKGWVTAEYGMLPRSTTSGCGAKRRPASRPAGPRDPAPDRAELRAAVARRRSASVRSRSTATYSSRWRHAHGRDHRRMGCALSRRAPACFAPRRSQDAGNGSCRSDLMRHSAAACRSSISIMPRTLGRDGRQFRHDGQRRHRRGARHSGRRPILRCRLSEAYGAGAFGDRQLIAMQKSVLGLG